jgi:hypothetical protein
MSNFRSANHGTPYKVYFSTVIRSSQPEKGGEIVMVDWQSKTVKARQPVYPTNPNMNDPNPRGNTRGGRGIEYLGNEVVVANYHTLKVYDQNLNHLRDISHPLFAGLHETFSNGNGCIWSTSTAIDAVIGIDIKNNDFSQQYWPREMPGFQHELNLIPLEIDKQIDNRTRFLGKKHNLHPSHLHLNAVAIWNGEMYGLFNSFGVIANLDKGEIVIKDKSLRHPHNLYIEEDGTAVVNNTFDRSIHIYNLHARKLERKIKLTNFGIVRRLYLKDQINYLIRGFLKLTFVPQINAPRPVYLRGLDKIGDLLFVGISPATILCIDVKNCELLDSYSYSSDVNNCIHGLKVVVE